MSYKNRKEAAKILARKLFKYRGKHPLVLAIPRGAVEMGEIIADDLEGELDVVLVRKLRAPGNPELAVGSVDETGQTYLMNYAQTIGADEAYLAKEKKTQMDLIRERRAQYTPIRTPLNPENRIVIVVDDGVATGSTFIAALRAIRAKNPHRLIAAIGVSPPHTYDQLSKWADEVVCPIVTDELHSVGQFYEDFSQATDEEVIEILKKRGEQTHASHAKSNPRTSSSSPRRS